MPPIRPHHGMSCQTIARRAYRGTAKPNFWDDRDAQLRYLFRSLLRECKRLPDPAAHSYLTSHLRKRYRASEKRVAGEHTEPKEVVIQMSLKALSQLRAANAGFLKPLTNVLLLTYGRVGRRRHELLEPLRNEGKYGLVEDTKDPLRMVLSNRSRPPPEGFLKKLPRLTPPVLQLLQSQFVSAVPEFARKSLPKSRKPEIPQEDRWKREIALKRVKNLIKEWHSTVLEGMLPPLEKEEWERLRDLATGKLRFWGYDSHDRAIVDSSELRAKPHNFVKASLQQPLAGDGRSIKGKTPLEDPDTCLKNVGIDTRESGLEQFDIGSSEVNASSLDRSLGITKPNPLERRNQGRHRRHTIDHRFMRRIWRRVFETCPMMTWNSAMGNWNVAWGKFLRQRAKPKSLVRMSNLLLEAEPPKQEVMGATLADSATASKTDESLPGKKNALATAEHTQQREEEAILEGLARNNLNPSSKMTDINDRYSSPRLDPEEDIINFKSTEILLQEIERKMSHVLSEFEVDIAEHGLQDF